MNSLSLKVCGLMLTALGFGLGQAALAADPLPRCAKDRRFDALVAEKPGVVLVGDVSGSNEIPRFMRALTCHFLRQQQGEVQVGLPLPVSMQEALGVWMASAGTPADRAALLAHPFWRDGKDGRASMAMLELLGFYHDLAARKMHVRILPLLNAEGKLQAGEVAGLLSAKPPNANPVIALLERDLLGEAPDSVASLLEQAAVNPARLHLRFAGGGKVWACRAAGCGIQPIPADAMQGRPPVGRIERAGAVPRAYLVNLGVATYAAPASLGLPAGIAED